MTYSPHTLEVRGVTHLGKPAPASLRGLALLIDLLLVFGTLGAALVLTRKLPAAPQPEQLSLLPFGTLAVLVIQQWILSATVGQKLLGLKLLDSERERITPGTYFGSKLYLHEQKAPGEIARALIIGIGLFTGASYGVVKGLASHPLYSLAAPWQPKAFAPETDRASEWRVAPFFYAIGAWPRSFEGKPVFHTLPYEKGPPTHFVGHVVARWDLPEIRVTFEGPKTPEHSSPESLQALRACMSAGTRWNLRCVSIREQFLSKHIAEIRAQVAPTSWSSSWFEVDNPALPALERPRGIYLSARNEDRAQERFLLINPRGSVQAVILDRPLDERGDKASELFRQAIRSQRVSDELNSGRAWVDRELASVKLPELLKRSEDPGFLGELAGVQQWLIAKITVEPKTFDAYFHLAGTSSLLGQLARARKDADLSAIAQILVQSSVRYGQDVRADHPKITLMQAMLSETKN